MKLSKYVACLCLVIALPFLVSCGAKKKTKEDDKTKVSSQSNNVIENKNMPTPVSLPVRFQTPSYQTANADDFDDLGDEPEEYKIKVGANIRSTGTTMPLELVLNRLANLKGMTVSWANDVNQNAPVNVNIAANDDFSDAIQNLLRQVDLFHKIDGRTIVILNKDTKVYQLGIPAIQGAYTSNVGGNFLANKDAASGTEGNVKIVSQDNKFDIWKNVENNLNVILGIITEGEKFVAQEQVNIKAGRTARGENANISDDANVKVNVNSNKNEGESNIKDNKKAEAKGEASTQFKFTNRQTSPDGEYYVIDKNIGLITVTAKPVNLKRVDDYINRIKKELFKQVAIEAKIIEVYLQDNSKIGLDWSSVLKDFRISATTYFGNNGQVHPRTTTDPDNFSNTFVSRVEIPSLTFDVFLNALEEQGDTHVLANPKLTVLNGQPAIISVGKDVAYIKSVTREKDSDTEDITYSAEVGNVVQGIALGVMASVLDDNNKIVLHLTPVTTDLANATSDGEVPITTIGEGETAMSLGLPQVKVREMSTMVEVENGEMLIIGGLIDSIEGKTGAFAPGLGSIPVVKYLFGVEEKTLQKRELVILLTPRII